MEENKVTLKLDDYLKLYNKNMLIMTMKRLQMNLKFLGYYGGEIDGIKGSKTLEAIKKFQSDHNLTVDGIAGQKTIDCIRAIIVAIQEELRVTVDGVAGTETITAYNELVGNHYNWDNIKYFKQSEFDCPDCGLNNMNLKVVKIADKIREHFGRPAHVTSGSRCTKHNKEVNGKSNSRHLQGKAIDMYVQGIDGGELLNYLQSLVNAGELRYTYRISPNGNACHFDIL